ncbi:MAG TPA: EAL domain-containing protein [Woeseiaceae bacterium]|nr:EAL domain-containing protein [Woeseiaceae bacterium]
MSAADMPGGPSGSAPGNPSDKPAVDTPEPLARQLRILYVGDYSLPGGNILQMLRQLDAIDGIHQASDPAGIRDEVARINPDIVVLDVGLTEAGRQRGKPATAMAELPGLPVIAVTARVNEHRGMAAVQHGAQDYLCLDEITPGTLIEALHYALDRHQFVRRMQRPEDAMRTILHGINDGVIVVDEHGVVISINPAGRSMLGLGPRERPTLAWHRQFCAGAPGLETPLPVETRPLPRALAGEKFSDMEALYETEDQPPLLLSLSGRSLTDAAGRRVGAVVSFRDVTDRRRRAGHQKRPSLYDPLTELASRGLFTEQLSRAISRASRHKRELGVLFIDLDRFKSVNDTLGHDTGDRLLQEVALRLVRELRISDLVGRWNADQFVVCIEDVDSPQDAATVGQKLVLALEEQYFVGGNEVYLTPSIGVALYPEAGGNPAELVKAAGLATGQAKSHGGGRFQFHSAALNHKIAEREELEVGLRHALVRRELLLHYQPRIDVRNGRLIGFEALLRWQHPRFGLLAPERFLPILESSGLIHSVGEWIMASAAGQLKAWQNQFDLPDLTVAVNLSPAQLARGRIVEAVARALGDTNLDPGCLELEIMATGMNHGRRMPAHIMAELNALGVRISLDRFGTQDISFRSLDSGVVDTFVIDRSLIADLQENEDHQRLVRAAIAMARGLDIEVAAEGVETAEQLDFLRECNCDLAQGFLFSRPMHPEKVSMFLRDETGAARRV